METRVGEEEELAELRSYNLSSCSVHGTSIISSFCRTFHRYKRYNTYSPLRNSHYPPPALLTTTPPLSRNYKFPLCRDPNHHTIEIQHRMHALNIRSSTCEHAYGARQS